jgi:catechol 2,3-dioxygenase-like lactoylglutathione lyase family enzyme
MAMTQGDRLYDVGGVLLPRPFKIRRLGHFGVNVTDMEAGLRFYRDLLGFKLSDILDFGKMPWAPKGPEVGDTRGYFMRYGTDHHAFVLFNRNVLAQRPDRKFRPEVTVNQITWQVGSLSEVVDAVGYFKDLGVEIQRVGRDMPGSNWHTYVYDPDGHTIELYYGIEQIGWNGLSKPEALYYRGFRDLPPLPQMSEETEVEEARDKAIDLTAGNQGAERLPARFDVGGVLLPRPFKITKIGPVKLFVQDVDAAAAFYERTLGFTRTEEAQVRGRRCVFLRQGTEHHSLALVPKDLREPLGFSGDTTLMSFGCEVASYQQLKAALAWLREHGVRVLDVPAELSPGVDYHAHVVDPAGHAVQLYYYMEQVGWDGRPRPAALRRHLQDPWPDALEPLSDTYTDQTYQGPWG